MIRTTLTLLVLAALAACGPPMATGPDDPLGNDLPQEGADPPGTTGPNATPWWGV